ncbi:MAG TPA: LytR C-terminal domain-containing protein [Sphingomicrobium sp.]|nr:LytR C-terminal domain-containing protein [Sphingomicrobium sp.]
MRTASSLGVTIVLLATACASSQPAVEIRAASSNVPDAGTEYAEAQLALGNVALALEGFKKTLRGQPGNVAAQVGIARAYERMGRFDVARRWYETALASAPRDANVLNRYATSLERNGFPAQANAIRTVEAGPALSAQPEGSAAPTLEEAVAAVSQPAESAATGAASVTVALPPPAPVVPKPEAAKEAPTTVAAKSQAERQEPRLVRLSLGEVALLTRAQPVWDAKLVRQSAQSVTFKFVEVRPVARLLNAARKQGLAARTRERLTNKGWKPIEIGDAPAVREKTLVVYPASKRQMAERLAKQFGFAQLHQFAGSSIVVLLGRDAARRERQRPA